MMNSIRIKFLLAFATVLSALSVRSQTPCPVSNVSFCYTTGSVVWQNFTVVSSGDYITVDFISGNVENTYDELEVYDGLNGTGNLLYSGYGNLGDIAALSFVSTTGVLSWGVVPDVSIDCNSSSSIEPIEYSVSCSPPPTCIVPDSLASANLTSTSFDLLWYDVNNTNEWEVSYGLSGITPDLGNRLFTTAPSLSLSNLSPLTSYDIFIRAICGPSDTSAWTSAFTVTTYGDCNSTGTLTYGNNSTLSNSVINFMAINPGDYITISFDAGSTESCCDDYYVTDGPNGTGNVLATGRGAIGGPYESTTGIISLYILSDGSIVGTPFEYRLSCSPPPSCLPLSSLSTSAVSSTQIEVSFTDPNPMTLGYFVTYGDGTTIDTVSPNPLTSPSSLTGLTPNTEYLIDVRAICSVNDTSASVNSISTTPCDAIGVPFTEDFDGVSSGLPSCWLVINGGTADAWTLNTSSLYSQSGSNSATIYTDFNSGDNDDYLITPLVSLTGNEELTYSFRVRSSFEPQDFEILISTTGNNASDFTDTLLANAIYSNTVYETNTISLSAYSGDCFIAFHVPSGGEDGYYLYIDDVIIDNIPSCQDLSNFSVSATSTTSAELSFNDPNNASEYVVTYSDGIVTDTISPNPTSNTIQITGLISATTYTFSVEALCSVGDTSRSSTASLTTPCIPFITPFVENFDGVNSGLPSCWSVINGGTADAWTLNTSSLYSQSGSNSATIYTDFNSGNNDDYLITPQISLTGNQELTYSYRVRSSLEPQDFQILLSTTSNNALDFTDTLLANVTYSNTVYETNTIDLTNYTGDVYIAFHVVSGGLDGYYLYIDDVAVESIPTCLPPTQVGAAASGPNSANVFFTDNNVNSASYLIWYSDGITIDTLSPSPTASPASVTGLLENTSYTFTVETVCDLSDTSSPVTTSSIVTPCDVLNNSSTEIVNSCNDYTWNVTGLTYSSSGIYQDTVVKANGCDSILILDLTINNSIFINEFASACDSFEWNGTMYNQSGLYSYTTQSSSGCDSTVGLDLNISYSSSVDDSVSACGSYQWIDGVVYEQSMDTVVYALTSISGCDSLVRLVLEVQEIDSAIVMIDDFTIGANQNGAVYQWYNCDNGFSPISNANAQTYQPNNDGNYAVEIMIDNCTDTSRCIPFQMQGTGLIHSTMNSIPIVYPNTFEDQLNIDLGLIYKKITVNIYSLDGKNVWKSSYFNRKNIILNTELTHGFYQLVISDAEGGKAYFNLINQ